MQFAFMRLSSYLFILKAAVLGGHSNTTIILAFAIAIGD